jgi:lipoprotein-anchoring transpeptidase ErfK/SrfK
VVGHEAIAGERWARTSKRLWIAETDVAAARPTTFHGQLLDGNLPDIAWVISDNASTWPTAADPPKGKRPVPLAHKARFEVVSVLEEQGSMLRVDDGAWMRKSDVARPALSSPPVEVTGEHERWIDVDRASQTLVAYEGHRPVLATLTSTGRELDDKTRTPAGVHRVWMKLLASDMGHAERDDAEANYALEDVPYVQFFDNGIGLHGTYWHSDFGHPRSHGCVNLSLADAKWLFSFTNPRLPAAWTAAAPTIADAGTVVRVR